MCLAGEIDGSSSSSLSCILLLCEKMQLFKQDYLRPLETVEACLCLCFGGSVLQFGLELSSTLQLAGWMAGLLACRLQCALSRD